MNKIFSWIKNGNGGVRKWRSSGLNNIDDDSADFDSYFEDRFAATSTPILNDRNENTLNSKQRQSYGSPAARSSTFNSRSKNANARGQRTTTSARRPKHEEKEQDSEQPTLEKNYLNRLVVEDQSTSERIRLDFSPTPSPSGSFRNSIRHLKRRLISKRKTGMTELDDDPPLRPPSLPPPQPQQNQKSSKQKKNDSNQKNNKQKQKHQKSEVVSIFINEPFPECQEPVVGTEIKSTVNSIDANKNFKNTLIQDLFKNKNEPNSTLSNTNSIDKKATNKKFQIKTSNVVLINENDNSKKLLENDVLITSGFQVIDFIFLTNL